MDAGTMLQDIPEDVQCDLARDIDTIVRFERNAYQYDGRRVFICTEAFHHTGHPPVNEAINRLHAYVCDRHARTGEHWGLRITATGYRWVMGFVEYRDDY